MLLRRKKLKKEELFFLPRSSSKYLFCSDRLEQLGHWIVDRDAVHSGSQYLSSEGRRREGGRISCDVSLLPSPPGWGWVSVPHSIGTRTRTVAV